MPMTGVADRESAPRVPADSHLALRLSARRFWLVALVVAATLGGLILRLEGLDQRTLTHPEAWVPRVPYPEYVTALHQRRTVPEVIESTLVRDRHPPGFYLGLWWWTGIFGTGVQAIRVPSAIAGAAVIPLVFLLTRTTAGVGAAVLSAILMALHGYHLFWSQQARMWVFLPLLAVASALSLVWTRHRWRPMCAVLYVVTATAGMWLQYYFWPVFAAQVVWVLFTDRSRERIPPALGLQAITAILSTPLLAFLRSDWRWMRPEWEGVSEASTSAVYRLLSFGRLLDPDALADAVHQVAPVLLFGLFVLGTWLVVIGSWRRDPTGAPEDVGSTGSVAIVWSSGAAVAATLFQAALFPQIRTNLGLRVFVLGLLAPWVLAVAWWLAPRAWPYWRRLMSSARLARASRVLEPVLGDPVAAQLLIPLGSLSLAALWSSPLVDRGLVILTPFLLILVARGAASIRRRVPKAVVGGSLVALSVASAVQSKLLPTSPFDYQALARQMRPLMRADDRILVDGQWWAQPMHYYLSEESPRTVDIRSALTRGLDSTDGRIWVVEFPWTPSEELRELLRSYHEVEQLVAVTRGWGRSFRCTATLYEVDRPR